MTEATGGSSPYGEDLLREAMDALDQELAEITVRKVVTLEQVLAKVKRPRPGFIPWRVLAAYLRANPYTLLLVAKVYAQAIHKFHKKYPDITVLGVNHHVEETGRRVAQMFAIYVPGKEKTP